VFFLLAPFLLGGLDVCGACVHHQMFDHGGLCKSQHSAVVQQVEDTSSMSISIQLMQANNLALVPICTTMHCAAMHVLHLKSSENILFSIFPPQLLPPMSSGDDQEVTLSANSMFI
jgi:hypothetical protein